MNFVCMYHFWGRPDRQFLFHTATGGKKISEILTEILPPPHTKPRKFARMVEEHERNSSGNMPRQVRPQEMQHHG